MDVLLFTQYYPPEVGATQNRLHTFATTWAADGARVRVITEVPNHPGGVVFEGWRRRAWFRTREDGTEVLRLWVAASPRKTRFRRLAFYLTYCAGAMVAGLVSALRRRPDVVVATSPPLFVLLSAAVVAMLIRRPLVLDIRDVWPKAGVAAGELSEGRALDLAHRLERWLYRRAAAVVTVTRSFAHHIEATGVDPASIHLVPNGTMIDVFAPVPGGPELRADLGLAESFVVGYVGNHGILQGLDAVLEAAAALRDLDVVFLFVGEGPVKAALERRADQEGLDHVRFMPQVPLQDAARWISACDVMLVPLRDLDAMEECIPSKLFDYLACERPVVVMAKGEAPETLEETGGGWSVPPEDADALAARLRELRRDPEALARRAGQGRAVVVERFDRRAQARSVARLLRQVARLP